MKQTLGTRLIELRKKKGWTQDQLAVKLSISSQAISKWENDTSMPDIGLLVKIAELYNVTTDYLLGNKHVSEVSMVSNSKKDLNKLVFKVNILSTEGDKVKVNLPMQLVMLALESGVIPKIDGRDVLKEIDIKKLVELVEQGVIGKLVEIESKDGDIVEIVVE
jgi:transcriptional regulator with XRE-family HTH domain